MMAVRADLGMIFQEGALFDSLTVRENVGYKLYEESDMPIEQAHQRVEEVLGWVGLDDYIDRMPSELSGGQRRRVAIARAMAFKPRILLYDEATTGLDPITATTVDEEIIKLRDLEHVSSIVVTHQLRDAFYVATHMAERDDKRQRPHRAGDAREGARGRVHHDPRGDHRLRRRCRRAARLEGSVHPNVLELRAKHMPRTRSLAWSELKIGLLTITAIVIASVLVFSLTGGKGWFWQRYTLKTRFPNVAGLAAGSPVRVAGVQVGSVKDIVFAGEQVDVVFDVNKKVQERITDKSIAFLGSVSLLGIERGGHHAADHRHADTGVRLCAAGAREGAVRRHRRAGGGHDRRGHRPRARSPEWPGIGRQADHRRPPVQRPAAVRRPPPVS